MLNKKSFVKELNKTLKSGGVISFVTDTVWGIGCLPNSQKGADKIYEIKGRDKSKPLILMSNSIDYLRPYVKNIPLKAEDLINNYFPGALTIILNKSDKTPDFITSGKNTVGIRVPDNNFFKKLCSVIDGHVLATTSANLSNHPSSKTYEQAKASIGKLVDIIFKDGGFICNGLESTVISVENDTITILRQGAVKINNLTKYHQS
ncbi:MAG: threonylcarbamoyl-AMP synthase [Candidatus Gastranaerophilales bacterium]|nr:threonylcarbamoyl-AMP synthase [Candidatus Gastranaerophilales bacterium]